MGAAQRSDIRVDVTLARVPFVATDSDGKPIRDLLRDELTVTEDGVPQEIKYLWTEMDLPLTVGLVIDISSSQMGFVRSHRDSVERFITHVIGPADRVLLATVDEQPRLVVELTSSSDELARGTELIRHQRHAGERFGEPCQPPERLSRRGTRACVGTAVWDGVFHVVRSQFLHAEGRKALVLLLEWKKSLCRPAALLSIVPKTLTKYMAKLSKTSEVNTFLLIRQKKPLPEVHGIILKSAQRDRLQGCGHRQGIAAFEECLFFSAEISRFEPSRV
jgi:VWFA-related protein